MAHTFAYRLSYTYLILVPILAALLIILLSIFFPESLKTPGFAVSIPAFPFLMPYYPGFHLLQKAVSQ